jgi:hypothetical protein
MKRVRVSTAIAAWLISSSAFAIGSATNVTVTDVRIDADGKGMVYFSSPLGSGSPTCVQSGYANALAFDTNTAGGRSILAFVLAAQLSNTELTGVFGYGTCNVYGGTVEDWHYATS